MSFPIFDVRGLRFYTFRFGQPAPQKGNEAPLPLGEQKGPRTVIFDVFGPRSSTFRSGQRASQKDIEATLGPRKTEKGHRIPSRSLRISSSCKRWRTLATLATRDPSYF